MWWYYSTVCKLAQHVACYTNVLTNIYAHDALYVSRCKYYDVSRCVILYDDVWYVCTSRRDNIWCMTHISSRLYDTIWWRAFSSRLIVWWYDVWSSRDPTMRCSRTHTSRLDFKQRRYLCSTLILYYETRKFARLVMKLYVGKLAKNSPWDLTNFAPYGTLAKLA